MVRDFRSRVEDFLSRSKMAPSRFGKLAVGDLSFVAELRRGRDVKLRTVERVDRFIRSWERQQEPSRPRRRRVADAAPATSGGAG